MHKASTCLEVGRSHYCFMVIDRRSRLDAFVQAVYPSPSQYNMSVGTGHNTRVHPSLSHDNTRVHPSQSYDNTRIHSSLSHNNTPFGKYITNYTNVKSILCPFSGGRLGNHMFEYASSYTLARNKNMSLGLPADSELYKYFHISVAPLTELQYNKRCSSAMNVRAKFIRKHETFVFPTGKDIMLRAFLQTWTYFINFRGEIRRQFEFADDIRLNASVIVNNLMRSTYNTDRKNVTLVGIHVRRGDYLESSKIVQQKPADNDYIKRALKYFRDRYKTVMFIIATNPTECDRKWCQDNIQGNDTVLVPVSSAAVDLAILSSCDHSIMTVGTFGWWAGWLANGTTVYYKGIAWYPRNQYFWPGWIGL
jgi:galactoside 2-L-fucosyltransferase 1/2